MSEQRHLADPITGYASLLNAAHLLAEESTQKLHELASRYPDALPPEAVHHLLRHGTPDAGLAHPGTLPRGEDSSAGHDLR
jgi:hypothetical protein